MTVDRSDRMLVFDGDCGFCSRYAYWIAARLPADVEVAPWQTIDDLEAMGDSPNGTSSAPPGGSTDATGGRQVMRSRGA